MNKRNPGRFTIIFLMALPVQTVLAVQQPLPTIEAAVERFVQTHHEDTAVVKVKALDNRLRLPLCDTPLSADWSPGSGTIGRVTVHIACDSDVSWRIHVQATITREGKVWVLSRRVQRGDILVAEMLEQRTVVLGDGGRRRGRTIDPVSDTGSVLGFEFSRAVSAGEPLSGKMLSPRKLVMKGETVLLRYQAPGLDLQTQGVAIADGAHDEQIKVRNQASGKLVEAIVASRGVVDVLH
ncbi:MAG: flagellar basal body P-ring formation chaperone FlgA [Granulosicoccus sp.]